jgi:hypothetical protein
MNTHAAPTQLATKHDKDKHRLGLISSRFLLGLAEVLTFGAKKYVSHNWRNGFVLSRPYDALQRHLVAWNDGRDTDDESGLPTLYHAACELMFICELAETRPEFDDRYKAGRPAVPVEKEFCFPIAEMRPLISITKEEEPKLPHEVFPLLKVQGEWAEIEMENGEMRMAFTVPANGYKYLTGRKAEAFFWRGSLQ